jgi:hypothetical protein
VCSTLYCLRRPVASGFGTQQVALESCVSDGDDADQNEDDYDDEDDQESEGDELSAYSEGSDCEVFLGLCGICDEPAQ